MIEHRQHELDEQIRTAQKNTAHAQPREIGLDDAVAPSHVHLYLSPSVVRLIVIAVKAAAAESSSRGHLTQQAEFQVAYQAVEAQLDEYRPLSFD